MLYAQSDTSEAIEAIEGFKSRPQQIWQQIERDLKSLGISHFLPSDAFIARLYDLSECDRPDGLSIAGALQSAVNLADQSLSGKSKITLKISGDVRLKPRQIVLTAVLLKLALESALRHTVPKTSGTISCTFDCEDNQCLLTVRDDGSGLRKALLGQELLPMVRITGQLDGTLECHPLERCTCIEVSFPAVPHQQIIELEEKFGSVAHQFAATCR
jgi:two-component sensor histidine kinase